MSVAVESHNAQLDSSRHSGNQSPREQNRPSPIPMGKIPLSFPVDKSQDNTASGIKPSPGVYRQSTMTGSYSNDSRDNLQQRSVQYHYEVPNLSSMLYEYTNKEKDRVN